MELNAEANHFTKKKIKPRTKDVNSDGERATRWWGWYGRTGATLVESFMDNNNNTESHTNPSHTSRENDINENNINQLIKVYGNFHTDITIPTDITTLQKTLKKTFINTIITNDLHLKLLKRNTYNLLTFNQLYQLACG